MPYRQFHDFFPDVAERETRTLIVPPGSTKAALPVGEYAARIQEHYRIFRARVERRGAARGSCQTANTRPPPGRPRRRR